MEKRNNTIKIFNNLDNLVIYDTVNKNILSDVYWINPVLKLICFYSITANEEHFVFDIQDYDPERIIINKNKDEDKEEQ